MILQVLPPDLLMLLENIEALGFSLCLVGGFNRDFFYSGIIGHDLDFEIRRSQENYHDSMAWQEFYKKLPHFLLEKRIPYRELPYLVTRVFFEGFTLEFSSPRTEKNIVGNYSHHHFEVFLDSALTYELSFKRRDFTINAIGVEFSFKEKREIIIDPFNGMSDLKNKMLKHVSDDFFLDQVRFLRLIRFKLKLSHFLVDDQLDKKLIRFNLEHLSIYHFKEELFKSIPYAFFNQFREIVLSKKMIIPASFLFWMKYQFPEFLSTEEDFLAFVYLKRPEEAPLVVDFFSMPERKLKNLKTFITSFERMRNLAKKDLTALMALPQEEALQSLILKDLKNLEDKKEWRSILMPKFLSDKLLIDWDDWAQVTVKPEELLRLNSRNRSYYLFYQSIKKKINNDEN